MDKYVTSVYSNDTVKVNNVQFWFCRFRSRNFDLQNAPRSGRAIIKNIDKVREIVTPTIIHH